LSQPGHHISAYQLSLAVVFSCISTAIFFLPGDAVTIVSEDAWAAVIFATAGEIILGIYPLAALARQFPKETVIQYSRKVLGRFGGFIIGLLICCNFFQIHAWTLREFGEISTVFLPDTTVWIFIIVLSLLNIFVAYQGIEVIVRCAEFVFPIGLFFLLLIGVVNAGHLEVRNLQPVFPWNMLVMLKASISPLDWLSTAISFALLAAFVNEPSKIKQVGVLAIGFSGFVLLLFTLMLLMVFGADLLSRMTFSFLAYANYGYQGSETLVVGVWFSWIFVRSAIYCFITVFAIAQLFNLGNYKFLIFPETILALVYSMHQYKSFSEMAYFFSRSHLLYLLFQLGLPLIIWSVFMIRKRFSFYGSK